MVARWAMDYYSWWQAETRDIWRIPADGGAPEQLTHGAAGVFACESADRKSLLFQPKDADSPLMAMPLAGGQARQLIDCVKNSAFGVGPRGVYYVPCDPPPTRRCIFSMRRPVEMCNSADWTDYSQRPLGINLSPDGNTIVYPRQALLRADLMLIENFR